jgi:hypothetical protein
VHGVGPLYVAKTSRSDQWPDWKDLRGVVPDLGSIIDPSVFELDADQLVSGTIHDERLPIAAPGEVSNGLVRGNDPRLTSRASVAETAVPMTIGTLTTIQADGKAAPASCASPSTAAVGFIAESYGVGESAIIWPFGIIDQYLPSFATSDHMIPLYLGLNGGFSRDMPQSGIIQHVGTVIGVTALPTVRVFFSVFDYMEII